jgi:hypothetical protein
MKKTLTITSLVAAMSMSVFAAQPTQTHVNQAFVQEATQTKVNAPVDNQTAVPVTTVTTANTAAPAMKAPVAGAPAKATKTTVPAVTAPAASAPAKATKTTAPAVKTPVASAPVKATKTTAPAVKIPVASAPAEATKATVPAVTAPAAPKVTTSATREDAETMDTAHAMNVPNADEVRVVKHDTGLAVKDVEDATTVNKAQAPKEEPAKKATSANKVTK